jgi:hypothetical protein
VNIGRRKRRFCSSVPWVTMVGPASAMKNVVGSVGAAPASRSRRSTTFEVGTHAETAEALGEVHPCQPGVVAGAAELDGVGEAGSCAARNASSASSHPAVSAAVDGTGGEIGHATSLATPHRHPSADTVRR